MTKHILYLASGNSCRFGENKLLYPLNGKALYLHGLEMLMKCVEKRKDCTLTVVSRYEQIRREAAVRGIPAVDSPESAKGVSYTIRAGLNALKDINAEDFVVFVVADQPYLSAVSVERLLDCAREGIETASLMYGERPGNPTLFSAKLIPELLALKGDVGGRAVLKRHRCVCVQAETEKELIDIDVKEEIIDN